MYCIRDIVYWMWTCISIISKYCPHDWTQSYSQYPQNSNSNNNSKHDDLHSIAQVGLPRRRPIERHLYTSKQTLYSMRRGAGSQCRTSLVASEVGTYFLLYNDIEKNYACHHNYWNAIRPNSTCLRWC